ncbi:MAG: glycoside hydrolase family 9 protein [Firmicutes bacterium]|nr:glycoside hydrolase family 9 protein [Bacillota bacterium]
MIHIDQIGYAPSKPKFFLSAKEADHFTVVDLATDQPVYTGTLSGPKEDVASGDTVYRGDFSSLRDPGSYKIKLSSGETSSPFTIASDVHQSAADAMLKAFYFQRCGCDLEPEHAGPYAHKACHLSDGVLYDDPTTTLPSAGGWHDAGDYGKYTVAAAKAVADLLLAYDLFPASFAHPIGIPESGSGMPDLLSEVRYELDWLQRMQQRDGAVFHKLTTRHFPPLNTMPEDDLGELVFSPVSYTATATFSAVMAMAARIYEPFDAAFAAACLKLAKLSFDWLTTHESYPSFTNPVGISTGEYGDRQSIDEAFWASAELYRTTREVTYHDALRKLASVKGFSLLSLGWADVGGYGTVAYLLSGRAGADDALYEDLLAAWVQEAQRIEACCQEDGYSVSLLPEQYIWGSMMVLMNQAMHLILADHFTGQEVFATRALDHLHYLFGRNPLGQSYVSGFGERPLMHPHHRPSVADGIDAPVPGLVSGGPNRNLQDPKAKETRSGQPPARCFIDHEDSYATNEITIYWNSPAVFVAAYAVSASQ